MLRSKSDLFFHIFLPLKSTMQFQKLDPEAIIPTRGTARAAGFDLYALAEKTIVGGDGSVLVPTGIAARIPPGSYGRIAMRSGLAVKEHLSVSAGVVDEDYFPGHVQVVVYCTKVGHSYTIKRGERFAQIIPEQLALIAPSGPKVSGEFGTTGEFGLRTGGFGSTGQ